MNKLYFIVLTLFVTSFMLSCSNDDSDENSQPAPQFADQNLQGNIEGTSWELASGAARSIVDPIDSSMYNHSFTLRNVSDTNICARFASGQVALSLSGEKYIVIRAQNEESQLTVGTYDLTSFEVEHDFVLDFFSATTGGFVQAQSNGGKLEITEVNTSEGIIRGKLMAEQDFFEPFSSINGNFEANYCFD